MGSYEQPFVFQCKKCLNILGDSSMMLIMQPEYAMLLKVNDKTTMIVGTSLNCKCGNQIGYNCSNTPDVLYSMKYRIFLTMVFIRVCATAHRRVIVSNKEKVSVILQTTENIPVVK